jgi:methylated-DNA-[protein]-cysteine S-methyltransferase
VFTSSDMNDISFTLFETALGACGIAWGPGGVVGLWLPEPDAAGTRRRILRRFGRAREAVPTPEISSAIEGCRELLRGQKADLTDVRVDDRSVPEFHRRVYAIARTIPPGQTLTYGEIAARLGDPSEARAVGQALGQNPFPLVVPCHRVLAANGKTGGFSAPGGAATKLRLLEIEGARARAIPTLFD